MIYLNSNTASTVTVTLYEKSISGNPFYTWQLADKDGKATIVFTADDYSVNPTYYNQFTVSVTGITGIASPTGSTCGNIFSNTGTFNYTVYEMENQYDLNISDAIGIVETGILMINGTCSTYVINTDNDNDTFFVDKSLDV